MNSILKTLAAGIAVPALLSGCLVVVPTQPDIGYPRQPVPQQRPTLITEFAIRANYGHFDSARVVVTPASSTISDAVNETDKYGRTTFTQRSASDSRYETYFSERQALRRERNFSFEQRDQMTVEQTKDRSRMRASYNAVMSRVPRNTPLQVQSITCNKPAGETNMHCTINYKFGR